MPLADTGRAIGEVTNMLVQYLGHVTNLDITVGSPQATTGSTNGTPSTLRLNLFLYEAHFDPSMKNLSLDEGRPPPLWLVLKYLLTSIDTTGNSDSAIAHQNMGLGLRALQELSYLFLTAPAPLPASVVSALTDNPELLKITFDAVDADLISKVLQSTDDRYRFSMGFQVRPVMIATAEPPSYALLVGMDYTQPTPTVRDDTGVRIPVIPSLGPTITDVRPPQVALDGTFTVFGSDMNLSDLVVCLDGIDLPITAQRPDRLQCRADVLGADISAGSHALSVAQQLPGGRRRSSNLLVGALRPTLDTATVTLAPAPGITAQIDMTGSLLGRAGDDIFVGLYQDGRIVRVYDRQEAATPPQSRLMFPAVDPENQASLGLKLHTSDAVPAGIYRVILRVNGQQATASPVVDLTPP